MISKKELYNFLEKSKKMNMSKFLARYCNLIGNDLTKITHEDVKSLFPSIKRSSFEEVYKNPKVLAVGEVILVDDGFETIPYYAPKVDVDKLDEPTVVSLDKCNKKCASHKKLDYTKLSNYELRCLLRTKFNSCITRKKARCELEKRGIVLSKKYDRTENKRKLEEGKNEKY